MNDPLCKVCGANPCVHGEQSITAEEHEIDRLRAEVFVLRARLAGAEQIGAAAMRERDQFRHEKQVAEWSGISTGAEAEREACLELLDDVARCQGGWGVFNEKFTAAVAAIRARGGK